MFLFFHPTSSYHRLSWLREKTLVIHPTAALLPETSHVFLNSMSRLVAPQPGPVSQTDCVLISPAELWLEERVQIQNGDHLTALSTAHNVCTYSFGSFFSWLSAHTKGNG